MSTRIGFFLFAGLFLGAILGQWLPFLASIETAAGGLIGVLIAWLLDRRSAKSAPKDV